MAKTSGIGDRFYVGGYDLSGDVSSLGSVKGGPKILDFTALSDTAMSRQGGILDGSIDFEGFFNSAADQEHAVLKLLPATDVILAYARGTTVGNPSACMMAKQIDYEWNRGQDGALNFKVSALANAFGLEWCQQLTAGRTTIADQTTTYTTVDFGTGNFTAVNIASTSLASPSLVTTSTPHGLVVGDSIVIAGAATGSMNGSWTVASVPLSTTFTATGANDAAGGGAAGTVTKTSTNYGLSAYLSLFSLATGSVVYGLQDSADDVTYAAITGTSFTSVASDPSVHTGQRVQTGATAIIRRYVKLAVVSGTFTTASVFAAFNRFLTTAVK